MRGFPALVLAALVLAALGSVALPGVEDPLPEVARPRELTDAVRVAAVEVEVEARLLAQLATAEDPRAVAAVTWVVLTRAGCRVAPLRCERPILREILRPGAFGTVRAGRWRASWRPNGPALARVEAEVMAVLHGRVADPTGGATHFHRVGTWTPPWAPDPAGWRVLGSHAFYREARPAGTEKNQTV